eukprot:COSAG01_NODE_23722_length_804_cov_0.781560_1_plen_84_part_00
MQQLAARVAVTVSCVLLDNSLVPVGQYRAQRVLPAVTSPAVVKACVGTVLPARIALQLAAQVRVAVYHALLDSIQAAVGQHRA